MLTGLETALRRIGVDRYMMLLILTVTAGLVLPVSGDAALGLKRVIFWAIVLLFFLYGAKLPTRDILQGLTNWRLQLGILACTFGLFPLLGLALGPLAATMLPPAMGLGFLYIGCLPSTVQSSIAFTSVSGGNVAGAICAASISNLLAVGLTPALLALTIPQSSGHGVDLQTVWAISQQILLPFAAGQLARPWLSATLARHKGPVMVLDRGSILMIVYSAFSAGMVGGIWQRMTPGALGITLALCLALFGVVLAVTVWSGRAAGLPRGDVLALVYCGSTKSLATGLPMAGLIFADGDLSLIVLPLMIYHLMQLVLCSLISQRQAPSRSSSRA
ncbi:bile acid:sodium symporter [Rhodobacter sp. KR11]|uniref:bile acid:sodium symporter family protein n=1 Tax=Rhodobacter sp. KR11 TaxID=2974588 RepID=UPI002223D962|nr:bile acid:sodium symporter family protein [Rhodobacter sp. KR11]MCW1920311.1 bile acid:sodium symporter [Rhodobacter sp. KR11]